MPGVSTNTIWPPSRFFVATIRFLVVCGLSETMATLVPTMRLRRVDLPAFGRPINEANPARGMAEMMSRPACDVPRVTGRARPLRDRHGESAPGECGGVRLR